MILTCGLSPAWQHILVAEGLCPGEVNRASEVYWCSSGKVLNAAISIAHLGGAGRVVSVLGGPRQADIQREFEDWGVDATWVECRSPTRVCTTIIDSATGRATELVENAGELGAAELDAFRRACAAGATCRSGAAGDERRERHKGSERSHFGVGRFLRLAEQLLRKYHAI